MTHLPNSKLVTDMLWINVSMPTEKHYYKGPQQD